MNMNHSVRMRFRQACCIAVLAMGSARAYAQDEDAPDTSGSVKQEKPADIPYSFDDVSGNLVIITCKSPFGDSAGSGFIARMDGKTYIFTNQHVIMGAKTIRFVTVKGEEIKPSGVELSLRRDIARLQIADRPEALEISGNAGMGIPLAVFGNSEGAGVATELYGEVTGVGADLLEVSAEFVSGNSGSPVLNKEREVIGIASYVHFSRPSRMTENTRFENKARRFCYRINNARWMAVNWKKYNDEYGQTYRESEDLVDSIFDIINRLYEHPLGTVPENCTDAELKRWCGEHNRVISHRSNQSRREVSNSAEALSAYCQRRARNIEVKLEKRDLTGFLREEFEAFAYTYQYASEIIDYFGTKLPGVGY